MMVKTTMMAFYMTVIVRCDVSVESWSLFQIIFIAVVGGCCPDSYEVTFEVREYRPVSGGVNTLIGNNDASLVSTLKIAPFCTTFFNIMDNCLLWKCKLVVYKYRELDLRSEVCRFKTQQW
jgi:hypothetical protein